MLVCAIVCVWAHVFNIRMIVRMTRRRRVRMSVLLTLGMAFLPILLVVCVVALPLYVALDVSLAL